MGSKRGLKRKEGCLSPGEEDEGEVVVLVVVVGQVRVKRRVGEV